MEDAVPPSTPDPLSKFIQTQFTPFFDGCQIEINQIKIYYYCISITRFERINLTGAMSMGRTDEIGSRIRELRRTLKMTQSELAGEDFTKSFISQIEKGQTNPSLKSLQILAHRLGVSTSYLLGSEDGQKVDHRPQLIHTLERARNKASQGDLSKALQIYEEALTICPDSDHAAIGSIHLSRGIIFQRLEQTESARDELELAIQNLRRSHDVHNLARAYSYLGHLHASHRQHAEALHAFEAGRRLLQDGDPTDHLYLTLTVNLGITYSHLQRYTEAIDVLEKTLTHMEEAEAIHNFGKVCQTLGYAHYQMNDVTRAIEFTEKAVALYRWIGHWEYRAAAQVNLAIFLRHVGQTEDAHRLLVELLEHSQTPSTQKARAHLEMARLFLDADETAEALDQLDAALRIAPDHEDLPKWLDLVVRCHDKAEISYDFLIRLEEAIDTWKAGPSRVLAEMHSQIGELFTRRNDPVKANEHLSKSVALFRTLHQETKD